MVLLLALVLFLLYNVADIGYHESLNVYKSVHRKLSSVTEFLSFYDRTIHIAHDLYSWRPL